METRPSGRMMVSGVLEPVGTSPTDTVDVLCSIFLRDKTFCLGGNLMKTESVLRGGVKRSVLQG